MNKIKEPLIKIGDTVKDYNGHDYKVLVVSNDFQEVAIYDRNGMCEEFSTDEHLVECCLDPEDVLYCAVDNSPIEKDEKFIRTYVFLISRDSKILGE